MKELLSMIMMWLSVNFELPNILEHPHVKFVPAESISQVRHDIASSRFLAQQDVNVGFRQPRRIQHVAAFYDNERRVIYLQENWSPDKPRDLSILVHETVHHIQNIAGFRYACSAEREELAYRAQNEWLALFRKNLSSEFEMDAITLLVRTRCIH